MLSQEAGGSFWLLAAGPSAAATCTCSEDVAHLWTPRWQRLLMPGPGAHAGGAVPPESTWRKKLLWQAYPSPRAPPNSGPLPLWWAQASSRTPWVVVHHSVTPSGCLHAANHSPRPRVCLRSLSLSTQPAPAPPDKQLRLGTARRHYHLCRFLSALPSALLLLCSPPRL